MNLWNAQEVLIDFIHLDEKWSLVQDFCEVFLVSKIFSLETSAFQIFYGDNSTFVNLFDKTKFSCFNAYIF